MAAPKRNLFALGNNGGRPLTYETPEKLALKCNEYFDSCVVLEEKATITGLALFLGFSSRQALHNYKDKEVFNDVVKKAMLCVENWYELSGTNFDIFALKNMGWTDKQEHDLTSKGGQINIPITNWIRKGAEGKENDFDDAFGKIED
jgi:hypothetical protein